MGGVFFDSDFCRVTPFFKGREEDYLPGICGADRAEDLTAHGAPRFVHPLHFQLAYFGDLPGERLVDRYARDGVNERAPSAFHGHVDRCQRAERI